MRVYVKRVWYAWVRALTQNKRLTVLMLY